jgi:type II secretory pathway pseudopilin PulG
MAPRTNPIQHWIVRVRRQDGFLLVELIAAMAILAVGLMTLLAAFGNGYVALNRASIVGTASSLADTTLESYRGKPFSALTNGTTTTTYSSSTSPPSPDGRTYTVASTIASSTATNTSGSTSRTVKTITVTVSDASGKVWAQEQDTVDALAG